MTERLRAAAQALVDRWDSPQWGGSAENLRHTGEYITALRAALAEQPAEQEPVASIYVTAGGEREFDDWKHDLPVGRTKLYTAPQPAIPPGYKLVPTSALQWLFGEVGEFECPVDRYFRGKPAPYWWRSVFRELIESAPEAPQPAKRVQLTDEQIDAISEDHRDWTHQIGAFRRFARAIEAAHGITGETE